MTPLADQDDLTLGAMSLRPSTCELVHADGIETVEPQVMRVLLALARQPGRVLSRDAIVNQAWDGRAVSEDAINRVLSRLRRLSTITGAFRLSTIRKVGYRLDPLLAEGAPPVPGAPGPDIASVVTRRRMGWVLGLLALVAILSAGGALLFSRLTPPSLSAGPSLSFALTTPDPADAAVASAFERQMRETLSHMQGLRLIAGRSASSTPTDLMLEGVFGHGGQKPVIDLTLSDGRSGVRIWSARFDGRATDDPTAQERAILAAARFLAVRLGDGLAGQAAAREPVDPEVE